MAAKILDSDADVFGVCNNLELLEVLGPCEESCSFLDLQSMSTTIDFFSRPSRKWWSGPEIPLKQQSIECANSLSPFVRDRGRCRDLLCSHRWCCPIILSKSTPGWPWLCSTSISLLFKKEVLADSRYFPQLPPHLNRLEPEGLTSFLILYSISIIALRLPWPLANAHSKTPPANAKAPV